MHAQCKMNGKEQSRSFEDIPSASSQFEIHVSNIGCVRLQMGIEHGILVHALPEKVIISHP